MQSFREQSNYHGNPSSYPPETHGPSRLEEYSPRQQAQIFQGSYGGRRAGTATPTAVAPGENSNLQNYQAYRKESGDFYYLSNKEAGTTGGQAQQRRLPGPVQSYGPPQENSSSSSSSTGFSSHYGREGHHSQFAGQHSSSASLSQYSQDFPGSFSPGSGQYSPHVSSQQLRHQLYQSHQPISQAGNPPASTGTSHLQQIQRSANLNSPSGYPLRMGQFAQHYQSSPGTSSSSYPTQRFGQSGTNYEGYSPGGTSSPYESHMSASSYGTQQGYSTYTSQHLKTFEAAKLPQGGSQGQQQQNPSHLMQYSNASKLLTQNQTGQYNQSEVPVRSPMQFQQNFSPISNPSPAASVVQSPSCSSTPSPLMTSGENIQCGQGNVPLQSRNRILPVMPQLSPNTQIASFKGYGVDGPHEKRLTDPGLSSLSALSSQVANLPNTVQHMLLSDALAPHKKGGKRTSRKTDSCANSETSSQAEEQLKSPMAESLDGSCSSSSGDPGERVRQLSGQSTSSEAGYKGPPSEKPPSPVHTWQTEPSGKTVVQDIDTVPEPAETFQEISKPSEKSVGVIVSTETVANRSEKVVDEAPTHITNDDEPTPEPDLPETGKEEDTKTCQNGEPNMVDAGSTTIVNVPLIETDKSPVEAGFGFKEAPSNSQNTSSVPQQPKNSDTGTFGGQSERKTGRNDKYPSLLQEVLQGHHQQERRYVRNAQEQPSVTESAEVPLRPNVLMSQANDQPNRSILGKTLAPHLESSHWGQWDRKPTSEVKQINLADYSNTRKYECETPASCHEPSGGPSERRSVICDISPLRQLVRDPVSLHHASSSQDRSQDSRAGQSVILPSGMLSLEKSSSQSGVAKVEDNEPSKMVRKRTGEQCIPYSSKESPRGNASPRSMTYDSNQDYSSHGRSSNPKRGTGRVGSRGRSPAQSQDLSDKLKLSPGRSRGSSEIHHMTPAMSLSERASREALYSAFFQNADNSSLGFHTNSRTSSYGEPHPSFTSSLHYKRQMYQQEEYKEWLGSSAQAILSASQHRQDLQRKSPRQEPFHVRSPGRSEIEGLAYSQPGSFHEPTNIDFSRQIRMSETTSTLTAGDFKRSSQKTPPGDSTGWHLGRQSSPVKKAGSPASANQKPFSPSRDSETLVPRQSEPNELSKSGCNAHRQSGPEESSHHNPLIMRRKVRSFISPIPSKRPLSEDKIRPVTSSKESSDRTLASHIRSPRGNENDFLVITEEQSKSGPEQKSPTAVTLSSPTKTKILPPRKGRGLKLEAIVQKITSPNVRRATAPSSSESVVEAVTLDDILSLKGRGSEVGGCSMEETAERTVDPVPDISNNEVLKIQSLSPKSFEAWPGNDDKQIKKEIDEQFMETKELPQSGSLLQQSSNHYLETRGNSPVLEQKCSLPQFQPHEIPDKEKVVNAPYPVNPKQTITPPKGYFPSGKKKGRPIGSVNKQKKLQQQQQLQPQQQQNVQQQVQDEQQLQSTISTVLETPPPPQQTPSVSEQGLESEPKPKRRRRERRKQPGTARRRRGKQAAPIVAPIEPEIKLKYASQTLDKTETKHKSFSPYIHVESKEELGLSCVIINAEEEEQRWKKVTSARKDQRATSPQPSESKALPSSSFMVQGPAVTESASVGHLVCCFCGKWANYKNLGDLFGPFYTQEYASTLSKNPPPKKSSETPQKVKVRHKDALDGSKSDSDEEEEEPQQAREQRSLSAHPRYKRRNRSGDCAASRHAVPSRRKTTDACELVSLDSSGSVDAVPDQGFQIPQLPLVNNEFWMHEACVLWANGVYFVCGRLYGLQEALDVAREMICAHCQDPGATLGCFNKGCVCCYHFPCAMDSECLLNEENFSVRCPKHKTKTIKGVLAEQPEQG
ncbi:transcription factor 20 isoform X2 [Bufo gargarizans]|nr:transcription factor 20 isoform X2 [Bufo gargarizans]XP_044156466.1 transcription factor 20 isoform X2 [Bufo gargarizans]XP_044156468.1 transcription factor 20 isoform X2 [Bufo gargarizans]